MSGPDLPERPDALDRPRVGVDEWVERMEGRRREGPLWAVESRLRRVPEAARVLFFLVPIAIFPLLTSSGYLMQVGIDTLIFMLLALGLNVAVGWAGLLDLGYIAFFGFGAYLYAWLASAHFGVHWGAELVLPAALVLTAILGFVVGLPSRRLVGDYLAIVTLFFLQLFVTLLLNADRLNIPFRDSPVNFTRGPNGISDLDPFELFGWRVESLDELFYVVLAAFAVVFVGLALLNQSRTGRAWRALREDPLAAELMSMPVNRLKLLAFAFGAGIGGLTGTIYAAQQSAVFPVDVDVAKLITLYAMVILGGLGNLMGVAIGAIVINLSLEALRTPEDASWIFFGALVLALPFVLRPWWRWAAVAGGTIVFGFLIRLLAEQFWERGVSGTPPGLARIDRLVDGWVLVPSDPAGLAKVAYLLLVAGVLALTVLQGWWRLVAFVPVLYLAACVWENVMVEQPSVARYILIGAMLVGLMASRPQGLFGTTRVEIV